MTSESTFDAMRVLEWTFSMRRFTPLPPIDLFPDRPVGVRPPAENFRPDDRVALPQRVHDRHPLQHPSEDDVLAVERLRRLVGEEELAPVRVLPVVGQAQDPAEMAAVPGV